MFKFSGYKCVVVVGLLVLGACSGDTPAGGGSNSDTTPPVISNIAVTNMTLTSATISWNTDENASSAVSYGLTNAYGSNLDDTSSVTSHSVTLSGLSANTTYHFHVSSADAANNTAISTNATFMTLAVDDTTAPVISNVTSTNLTTTSATITWNTNENATSAVNYGLTNAYGLNVTSASSVTSHSLLLSGLSANTTYHFRVTSTDAANNVTTGSDNTFTTASSGGGGGETLTTYANRDLELYPINAFDESQAIPLFVTDGPTFIAYEATGNRLGGPCRKFTPPTSIGAYSGYGQFDLNKAGSFAFRRMAMRFEMQIGASYGSNNNGDAVKLLIINMTDTLGGATTTRPMLYLDARPGDETGLPANYVMLALAQGTTKRYSATASVSYPDGTTPFFFGPSATTWNGRPVVGAAEWVSVSYYMNSQAEAGYPNGRLWMKVTRQNGNVLADFSHAYNIDAGANADDFIAVLDILGGYYNFAANVQEATNFLRIAYPTFQANANAPLEPRTGFAQP